MLTAKATVNVTKRLTAEVRTETMKIQRKYNVYRAGKGKVCFFFFLFAAFGMAPAFDEIDKSALVTCFNFVWHHRHYCRRRRCCHAG